MKSTESSPSGATVLKVIDALDHPHGNRILRTRLLRGDPPSLDRLKGATLQAVAPDGTRETVRVVGFPVFGGAPSTDRIRESGRVDLVVAASSSGVPVERTWEIEV